MIPLMIVGSFPDDAQLSLDAARVFTLREDPRRVLSAARAPWRAKLRSRAAAAPSQPRRTLEGVSS